MPILINDATSTNVSILARTNELFGITQQRVASGKRVFSAADDPTLFRASTTLLARSQVLSEINDNISFALATLETTDNTLSNLIGLAEAGLSLATRAQNEGSAGARATTSSADIDPVAPVAGAVVGSRLSITSDGGRNFTYTFNSTSVTWGEVINALNAANIGVLGEFVPSTVAGQTNLRFRATNDRDFRIDPATDRNVIDDLAGLISPNGQVFSPNNIFANGLAAPGPAETGFTIGFGGHQTGTGAGVTLASPVAAGTSIVFEDGFGGFRTLNYGAPTTVAQVINDVNALNAGIRAELVNQSGGAGGPLQLRLRNTQGGELRIVAASGDFASGGPLGFGGVVTGFAATLATDNALRLTFGQQYDAVRENIDQLSLNNPVPRGRNLLQAEALALAIDEYGGQPIRISGILVEAVATLGLAQAGASWINDQNVNTAAIQIREAIDRLREIRAQFAAFNNYIRARFDLNRTFLTDVKTQGDELVAADVSEESASLIALQTRQEFAVQAITIANQNEQSLLRLLG